MNSQITQVVKKTLVSMVFVMIYNMTIDVDAPLAMVVVTVEQVKTDVSCKFDMS